MINRDDSIIFRNPSSNVRASFSNETKDEQNNGEGEKKRRGEEGGRGETLVETSALVAQPTV